MIDFKDKDAQVPSLLIVLALVIFAGTLAYSLLVPVPKPQSGYAKQKERDARLRATEQAKVTTETATAEAQAKVFRGTPEEVTARVLADLTLRAQKGQVLITAFRPQKTAVLNGLDELPVSVQVTGEYPALIAFLSSIEQPTSKVAVRSFQVASTGDSTSSVAATIGISVYSPIGDGATPDAEPTKPTAKTASAPPAVPSTVPQVSVMPATTPSKGGSNG